MKGFFYLILSLLLPCALTAQVSEISRDEAFTVQKIFISGNKKTKESVILRELPFAVGDQLNSTILNERLIPEAITNLKNLNLFNVINVESDSSSIIRIEMVEKWYFWPIPFLEFSDRNFNQWWNFELDPSRTNFGLYLFRYNYLGLNHTVKFSLSRGYTNLFGFSYDVPWLGKKKIFGLQTKLQLASQEEVWYATRENKVQFFSIPQKTLQQQTLASIRLTHRPKVREITSLLFQRQSLRVGDTILTEANNPGYLIERNASNNNWYEIGLIRESEHRNNKLLPTSGYYAAASASLISNNPFHSSQLNYMRLFSSFSTFGVLKFINKQTRFSGAFHAEASIKTAKNLPYLQNRALGYNSLVRGYEVYVMDGNFYALSKVELRFHVIKEQLWNLNWIPISSYRKMPVEHFWSLFIDGGYANNPNPHLSNTLSNQLNMGYGIGFNTLIYFDKVFRFEYSFTQNGEGSLKVHFQKAF
jgi:outer membrane protein assembly factor BamA